MVLAAGGKAMDAAATTLTRKRMRADRAATGQPTAA
jgi:hypothetical protein